MTVHDVLSRVEQLRGQLGYARTAPTSAASATAFASTLDAARTATTSGVGTTAASTGSATTTSGGTAVGAATLPYPSAAIQPANLRAVTTGDTVSGVPYADLFNAAGARHGISPKLLAAVAKVESGYNPRAVSPAGARGLMQIMPSTAKGLGVTNAFDPAQAIEGAAKLLKNNLREFGGNLDFALAAYNAGGGAVRRYHGIPPYAETQAYVPKVRNALAALGGDR